MQFESSPLSDPVYDNYNFAALLRLHPAFDPILVYEIFIRINGELTITIAITVQFNYFIYCRRWKSELFVQAISRYSCNENRCILRVNLIFYIFIIKQNLHIINIIAQRSFRKPSVLIRIICSLINLDGSNRNGRRFISYFTDFGISAIYTALPRQFLKQQPLSGPPLY